jgi:cell division protein FtsB
MEQQDDQVQQNIQPVQQVVKNRALLFVIVSVLLTALLVGGGVYFWQQSVLREQTTDLTNQLDKAKSDNAILRAKLEDLEKSASEEATEKEVVEKKACKGIWKDGECTNLTCVDSDVNEKPDDIYIKGNVTYMDEDGVETVVYDECSGSKTQVNEMWCYESPAGSGNYVQGKMVYDCVNGCLDGACTK